MLRDARVGRVARRVRQGRAYLVEPCGHLGGPAPVLCRRRWVGRAPRVIRAATWRTRWRDVWISQRASAGVSAKLISRVQVTQSTAVARPSTGLRLAWPRQAIPQPAGLGLPDPVLNTGVLAVV